jgi:ribonuclease P protein component
MTKSLETTPRRKLTLCKDERIHHRDVIKALRDSADSIKTPALILVYLPTPLKTPYPAQMMVSVSKRIYKRSVDRNRIKRLMRESYRKQKISLYTTLEGQKMQMALQFIFTGRHLPNQAYIHGKMSELLKNLIHRIQSENRI